MCRETLRTPAGLEAISIITNELPDIQIGAGTVLTVEQARQAVSSGAHFIVSPGFDPKVVNWYLENEVLVIPGVPFPTEINMRLVCNLCELKFFPTDILRGPAGIKATGASYIDMKLLPTGGVSTSNLVRYLSLSMVRACGVSWMVQAVLINSGNFGQITSLVKEACNIVKQVR